MKQPIVDFGLQDGKAMTGEKPTNLKVSNSGNSLFQKHLSESFVGIGYTLHQFLSALGCLRPHLDWDLIKTNVLAKSRTDTDRRNRHRIQRICYMILDPPRQLESI